jgi:hypothetical protein
MKNMNYLQYFDIRGWNGSVNSERLEGGEVGVSFSIAG